MTLKPFFVVNKHVKIIHWPTTLCTVVPAGAGSAGEAGWRLSTGKQLRGEGLGQLGWV